MVCFNSLGEVCAYIYPYNSPITSLGGTPAILLDLIAFYVAKYYSFISSVISYI
jgi:hypothetical protein